MFLPARTVQNPRAVPLIQAGFDRAVRLALLALALVSSSTGWAAVNRWTPYGPGDGTLRSLVASPRGDLYTTTNFGAGEIWQRPAAAATWRWRGQGLGRPDGTRPIALAVHPKNPNTLWAVALESAESEVETVFRSTDAGATWLRLFSNNGNFEIVRLTVATTRNSVVLFAETGGGAARRLWRGTNAGRAWTEVPGVLGPIAGPPDEPERVYAVAESGGGLLKSTNGGRSFHPAGPLPIAADDEIVAVHATSGRPSLLLVSLRFGGLYRSTDGGASFRPVGFAGVGPSALGSEPGNPKKIYAGNHEGIFESERGGQKGSFHLVANLHFSLTPEPSAIAAVPGGPYFLSGGNLYRLSPQDFVAVDRAGIEAFGVAELRFSGVDPSFVALRRYTGCIRDFCDFRTLLSTDGGATFSRLGTPLSPRLFADVTDLAFDPADPRRRLLTTAAGTVLHEPDDAGLGQVVLSGPERTVEFGADGLFLAGGSNGVLISDDGGAIWTTALAGTFAPDSHHPFAGFRQIVDLEANPEAPHRIIARSLEFISGLPHDAGRIVLYKSADSGRTWSWLRDGDADVEFIPDAPETFYLLFATGTGTELRRSDDFGATSTLIRTFPATEVAKDLATDPAGSGDLYLATRLGVRASRDGGATWQPTAGGFNPFGPYRRWVESVQVAPDGRLIAAPIDGGLFENRLSN